MKRAPNPELELKVVPIGNSRGIRLPRELLAKYQIGETVVLQVREEGLLLRAKGDDRLSWEETYKAAAQEAENWSDLDATALFFPRAPRAIYCELYCCTDELIFSQTLGAELDHE